MFCQHLSGESIYLSPAHGTPVMYVNLEDYVSYATRRPNQEFQAVMDMFRSESCKARLHWGKAGWPQHAKCFDGATEYPDSWCHFGCAVWQMDPKGKFASESDVWTWQAVDRSSGKAVANFGSMCCTSAGFNVGKCTCAPRKDC